MDGSRAEEGHTGRVSAVAFSPDGKLIATGGWDNAVRLWDAAFGKLLRRLDGHEAVVYYVAFSPDGKTLASASRDHSVPSGTWPTARSYFNSPATPPACSA